MNPNTMHPMFCNESIDLIALKIYPVTYLNANKQLFDALEDIGRRNNLIHDMQTYSFTFKKYVHESSKTMFNNKRPKLDKSLRDEADIIYNMSKILYEEYSSIRRLLAVVLPVQKGRRYLSLLPSEIVSVFKYPLFDPSSNEPLSTEEIQIFTDKYSKLLEDLRVRVLLNSLTH